MRLLGEDDERTWDIKQPLFISQSISIYVQNFGTGMQATNYLLIKNQMDVYPRTFVGFIKIRREESRADPPLLEAG